MQSSLTGPNPVLSTQYSLGHGSVSQWNHHPLAEPYNGQASYPQGRPDTSGVEPIKDVWWSQHCSDLPEAGSYNELLHHVNVFDEHQQSTDEHHEEHSRQDLPVVMPEYGEDETQGSVHGQVQQPVQKKFDGKRRPLLSDKERATLPPEVLSLLDQAPDEQDSKDQCITLRHYLTRIINAREKSRQMVAQDQGRVPSQSGKGKRSEKLMADARDGEKILTKLIDGELCIITPTTYSSLPLKVAEAKREKNKRTSP